MQFVWHWPFFVYTLEERLAKLAQVEKSFLFHADLATKMKAAKDAAVARLKAQVVGLEAEIAHAERVATNFNALRTRVVATVEETVEGVETAVHDGVAGVEHVADDVRGTARNTLHIWDGPTDGSDNPR